MIGWLVPPEVTSPTIHREPSGPTALARTAETPSGIFSCEMRPSTHWVSPTLPPVGWAAVPPSLWNLRIWLVVVAATVVLVVDTPLTVVVTVVAGAPAD